MPPREDSDMNVFNRLDDRNKYIVFKSMFNSFLKISEENYMFRGATKDQMEMMVQKDMVKIVELVNNLVPPEPVEEQKEIPQVVDDQFVNDALIDIGLLIQEIEKK